jgi:hypothetical protein
MPPIPAPVAAPVPPPVTPGPSSAPRPALVPAPIVSPIGLVFGTTRPATVPIQEPIPAPSEIVAPTAINAPAFTSACLDRISTDKLCYTNGDNLVITFENCMSMMDDWVGIYNYNSDVDVLGDPIAWVNAW